jgi:hypothetical protein
MKCSSYHTRIAFGCTQTHTVTTSLRFIWPMWWNSLRWSFRPPSKHGCSVIQTGHKHTKTMFRYIFRSKFVGLLSHHGSSGISVHSASYPDHRNFPYEQQNISQRAELTWPRIIIFARIVFIFYVPLLNSLPCRGKHGPTGNYRHVICLFLAPGPHSFPCQQQLWDRNVK